MTSSVPTVPDRPGRPDRPDRPGGAGRTGPDGQSGLTGSVDGPPPWLRIELVRPVTSGLALLAIGIGVLGDLAVRSGVAGLAGALLVLATSVALLAGRRLRSRQARVLVALAPLFGMWLALRTSGWLLPLDLVAAFGLLLLGASLSAGGSVADLPFAGLLAKAWHAALHVIATPAALARFAGATRQRSSVTWAVIRGMVLAVPVVLLLGVLLVSADAVFASLVVIDLDSSDAIGHLIVIGFAGWVFLGLVRVASAAAPAPLPAVTARLGAVEALVVLGSVIVLFGGFAVSQAVALIGGAGYVQRTTGLTYAEYARSGFFQLLWVAALTVTGVLVLRAVTDRADPQLQRRFAVLSCLVCGLTLLIVAVAVRRLALYSDVYGLTMLRLYCTIFALWVGAVLVLLALWLGGVRGDRAWFPAAAAGFGIALLLGLNVANPEALVARVNLQREAAVAPDTRYITSELSDDAVPAVAALLPGLDGPVRDDVLGRLCAGGGRDRERFTGWAAWNRSRAEADRTRAALCGR